jgi:hypothetical protein
MCSHPDWLATVSQLGVATQIWWLLRLPHLRQGRPSAATANCRLTTLNFCRLSTDWLVPLSSWYSLGTDLTENTPSHSSPIVASHHCWCGVTENTIYSGSLFTLRGMTYHIVASLFILQYPSNGCLFWLNYFSHPWACNNIKLSTFCIS